MINKFIYYEMITIVSLVKIITIPKYKHFCACVYVWRELLRSILLLLLLSRFSHVQLCVTP